MEESLNGLKRSMYCGEVRPEHVGQTITVMGWVQKARNKGSLIFIDVRDRKGLVQAVLSQETADPQLFELAGSLRTEFVVAVTGKVQMREGAVNEKLSTGEVELNVEGLKILSTAKTTPFQILDEVDTREDLRLKYRYLDLRRPKMTNNLVLRHKVVTAIREFLNQENFIEIETPMLIKSTPEGARDYLVPSRVHPGHFYALPQSPQMYKQLLMISGMDRYYQVARCFRDEDLRADRQPEFTQIDMELSFVEEDDVMDVNERMIAKVFGDVLGWNIQLPLRRMTWNEAMDRYGSDKPDLRFDMEIVDVTEVAKDSGFGVFEGAAASGGVVRCVVAKGQADMPRKKIDALGEVAKLYKAKGLAWMGLLADGTVKSPIAKFMTEEKIQELAKAAGAEKGDLILFCADKKNIVCDALGNVRLSLGRQLDLIDPDRHEFLWVTEFPMFEYSEEENRYMAMHHPFTMPYDEDVQYLISDPGRVRAKAYDMVLDGCEMGGGSIRIHRRDVQEKVFEALGFSMEEALEKFGFFVEAFSYGAPPHGGLAFGLDRMIMLMSGAESIREVIAFPKVKDASCLMSEAPSVVDVKQLVDLHLAMAEEEKSE
ncbi:MAG: aspartate--tRNA ligase [Firmicutes bacterium]|nr:aspartate--tRNA ligase [Bacillota bacterium]